jgi:hypothetical protein
MLSLEAQILISFSLTKLSNLRNAPTLAGKVQLISILEEKSVCRDGISYLYIDSEIVCQFFLLLLHSFM